MEHTLRQKTTASLSWTALSQVIRQVVNLAVTLILARLLGPAAFGLLGMVVILTGFGTLIVELGMGSGLIQRKDLRDEHIEAVFWANLLVGTVLAALMALGAPAIAGFYNQPELVPITRAASLVFILGALGTAQSAMLSRAMRFRELAAIDITAVVLSGSLGVLMAVQGFGVWSLLAQTLFLLFARTAGLWCVSRWRPRGRFEIAAFKDLAGFGGGLLGYSLSNYWVRNADNLLIGKFLGDQALGLYSRAYQLMVLPVQQLASVTGNVMFPVLASVQHDLARVRSIYLRSILAIHLVAAPIYAGLFAVADTFVNAVLGERWSGLTPILRILCLVGFFQPVGSSTSWLYTALGRTDIMFKWGLFSGMTYVVGYLIGLEWGTQGVAWSYCVVGWLCWYPSWSIPGRLAGLSFLEMLVPLIPASQCAVAMGVAVWLIGLGARSFAPVAVVFPLQVLCGAALYAGLVAVLRLKSGREVVALIEERLRPAIRSRQASSQP